MSVESLIAWLVEGALDAPRSQDVMARVCRDLAGAGVPIDRVETFVRTLHPHVVGRSFIWRSGRGVEVLERSYEYLQTPEFLSGPVAETFRTGEYVRIRRDAHRNHIDCGGKVCKGRRGVTAQFSGKRLGFLGRAIPDSGQ